MTCRREYHREIPRRPMSARRRAVFDRSRLAGPRVVRVWVPADCAGALTVARFGRRYLISGRGPTAPSTMGMTASIHPS